MQSNHATSLTIHWYMYFQEKKSNITKPPKYSSFCIRFLNIIYTKLRHINSDLIYCNVIVKPNMFLWKLNRRCTCVKKNIHLSNLRQSFNYVKSFNVSEHSYYN